MSLPFLILAMVLLVACDGADDRGAERLDGVLSGIALGPRIDRNVASQCQGDLLNAAWDEIAEQGISTDRKPYLPGYLPPNTEFIGVGAQVCDGVLTNIEARFSVPADPATGRLGGQLQILRWDGDLAFRVDADAARAREDRVRGLPAVVVAPITADGYGWSYVILNEGEGLTVIRATGMAEAEIIRIAESLSSGGTR